LKSYYQENINVPIGGEEGEKEEGEKCFLIISGRDIIGKW
jgi:hypothetical protein